MKKIKCRLFYKYLLFWLTLRKKSNLEREIQVPPETVFAATRTPISSFDNRKKKSRSHQVKEQKN